MHKEYRLNQEEVLAKKNDYIDMLKKELETSNEMFKTASEDAVQKDLEGNLPYSKVLHLTLFCCGFVTGMSPVASTTSRFIKSGMSLTQIYNQYVTVSDELAAEREETKRLNTLIEHIVTEIEEKSPLLKKQREDYETALDTVEELNKRHELMVLDMQQLREDARNCKRNEGM